MHSYCNMVPHFTTLVLFGAPLVLGTKERTWSNTKTYNTSFAVFIRLGTFVRTFTALCPTFTPGLCKFTCRRRHDELNRVKSLEFELFLGVWYWSRILAVGTSQTCKIEIALDMEKLEEMSVGNPRSCCDIYIPNSYFKSAGTINNLSSRRVSLLISELSRLYWTYARLSQLLFLLE